jgi:hypothetical protein
VNSEARIRTLLADLAGGDPPVGIDLDRQITRGRRRLRYRRMSAIGLAFTAVLAVASGAATLLPRDNSAPLPVATGRPTVSILPRQSKPPALPASLWCAKGEMPLPRDVDPTKLMHAPSTGRSRALAAEVAARLSGVAVPRGQVARRNSEFYDPRCRPLYVVTAEVDNYVRVGNEDRWLHLSAAVDKKPDFVDANRRACLDPKHNRSHCLGIQHLPDGSTAYLVSQWFGGNFVQIVRADGTEISVTSGYQTGPNDSPRQGNPYTFDVLLDVAKHITVPW